jgi:hypothetical protein
VAASNNLGHQPDDQGDIFRGFRCAAQCYNLEKKRKEKNRKEKKGENSAIAFNAHLNDAASQPICNINLVLL